MSEARLAVARTVEPEDAPPRSMGDRPLIRISVRRNKGAVVAADAIPAIFVGVLAAPLLASGTLPMILAGAAVPLVWLFTLLLNGGYEARRVAWGVEEQRRILDSGIWIALAVLGTEFFHPGAIAPRAGALIVAGCTGLNLVSRAVVRAELSLRIARGGWLHRTLVVGTATEVRDVLRQLRRSPYWSLNVVDACLVPHRDAEAQPTGRPSPDVVNAILARARHARASVLAVGGTAGLSPEALRQLAWSLQPSDVSFVAPAHIARAEAAWIPVVPMDELQTHGARHGLMLRSTRILKQAVDRAGAAAVLLLLSPALIGIAIAVRCTSRGPVLFRQTRVGHNGRTFTLLKFRTMVRRAEEEIAELDHLNVHAGRLFKIRDDPRVTPLGRWLRRHSLDELPQLLNVLTGSMSLVGPRPPLPAEVAHYAPGDRRRLVVKPGMTGLWQVAGRSDLSWAETLRLDLHYIDSWSLVLDAMLLLRTLAVVVNGRGAY
ncbi:MAG TPA: sugar transferase [Candidatus Dormibacteraeota bacterium]|nr:sugar transferase [Candidatus Dormibacteraeota bacterium]